METITNYGFVIDNRNCIGCHACTVACKAEHDDALGSNRTWVKYVEKGEYPNTTRNFSVTRCNHCNDSPCTDICPVTALFERDDGIVDFDNERCIGCKACMQGCPYDSIHIDPETNTAAKCNYCSHRVDSGREPACVTVCPEDAIIAGDMEDPDSEISITMANNETQARKPEKGTEPALSYINGDEANLIPGSTAREEHYLWSDSPTKVETRGAAAEDFDLESAAESLATSDVDIGTVDPDTQSGSPGVVTETDGGVATDGGHASGGGAAAATERAYELIHNEAKRVYDIGEDHAGSWGWEVWSYTWTKSIAAGAMLVPAIMLLLGIFAPGSSFALGPEGPAMDVLGLGAGVGLVFLGLTGALLISKLGKPLRFHWVLLRPNWNSWLAKGAYVISVYGAALALVAIGWALNVQAILHPASLTVLATLATGASVYTAFLLGQAKGRDLWQSPAMPFHLFVQTLLAGAAITAIAGFLAFPELIDPSRALLATAIVGHLVLLGSEIYGSHQTEDAEEAVHRIVKGHFAGSFWMGAVLIGSLIPLVLLVAVPTAGGIAGAGVLALVGLLAFEYCWIIAPQTISLA